MDSSNYVIKYYFIGLRLLLLLTIYSYKPIDYFLSSIKILILIFKLKFNHSCAVPTLCMASLVAYWTCFVDKQHTI